MSWVCAESAHHKVHDGQVAALWRFVEGRSSSNNSSDNSSSVAAMCPLADAVPFCWTLFGGFLLAHVYMLLTHVTLLGLLVAPVGLL
jgi:hypothetical protein